MKIRRLPPLHALESFAISAQELSFKVAADRLHLTPSAVSHQIRALEKHLGFLLFERRNRALELTSGGRAYSAVVEETLSRLRAETERLRDHHRRPRLRISAGAFIATDVLLPLLPYFRRRHPHIDLTIETDIRVKDFNRDGIDIALRFGRGNWKGLRSIKLLDTTAVPVCAPKLAPRRPTLAALAQMPRIQSSVVPDGWSDWARAAGLRLPSARDEISVDSYLAVVEAASKGLGVALGLLPVISRRLNSGRLVAPWPYQAALPQSYYLVHRTGEESREEVRAFIEWVQYLMEKNDGNWGQAN